MVDTVLYFEGERSHRFRILRAVKNRFGPADEIGVFEMTGAGLAEVANPSALFLGERGETASGSAVFAGIEGTRPVLVEFQALVAPSALGTPRRAVVGWDTEPAGHGAGRAGRALRRLVQRAGRLSERRRRPAHRRAGGGSGGGRGAGLGAEGRGAARRHACFSARSASRAPSGRCRSPMRGCARPQSWGFRAPSFLAQVQHGDESGMKVRQIRVWAISCPTCSATDRRLSAG